MKLGYTEFSFGYAFTENLIRFHTDISLRRAGFSQPSTGREARV